MNIAMLGHKRMPSREGGIEVVVENLSVSMVQRGHTVTCWNRRGHHTAGPEFDTAAEQEYRGVRIRTVPTIQMKGLAAVTSSFFGALGASLSNAEVVHIHGEGPGAMCFLPKLFGKPTVVTVHGLDWQREKWRSGFGAAYIRWGERMTVRHADEIIVLSRAAQDWFLTQYGRKTTYIPNGITPPRRRDARLITERFGLEPDGYILFLGRLVPEKGIHHLIEAYQLLQTQKKLVIAGAASDTEDYVRRLKAQAGADDRILFPGFVRDDLLEELYSNAWVCVLPSSLEGMPLGLLEAMSFGNCCVVSDIPECTEVTGDCALTFPVGNAGELAKCLQSLLADSSTVARLKDAAADHVCRAYPWETAVDRTLDCYRRAGGCR